MHVMDAEGSMLRAYWKKHGLVDTLPASYERYLKEE